MKRIKNFFRLLMRTILPSALPIGFMWVVDEVPDIRPTTFICQYYNECGDNHIHQDLGDAGLFLFLLAVFFAIVIWNVYEEVQRIASANDIQKRFDLKLWRQYTYGLYKALNLTCEDRLTIYMHSKKK